MAQIDPEMQRRLTAVVLQFCTACQRMRDAATLASLDLVELAAALDEDLTASLEDATLGAIQGARGKPPVTPARG